MGADCCDGSDEYDGQVSCQNTCWEAGKAARENLKKKIETYNQGHVVRRQEIEQAKVGLEKDAAELKKLKSEEKILKGLVDQLKGLASFLLMHSWIFLLADFAAWELRFSFHLRET